MEENYDMVPHNEILRLKRDVEELRRSPGAEIKKSMEELTDSIKDMNNILREAAQEMKTEESETLSLNKRMHSLINKLDAIIDENKIIAESMISFARLIKDRFPPTEQLVQPASAVPTMPKTVPPRTPPRSSFNMPPPPMHTAPQNMPSMPPPVDLGLPPPPPNAKQQGLLGKLRK